MTNKEQREQIMSDEDRIASFKAKGRRCSYCRGRHLVDTITDRLFACCNICAQRDNKATVLKDSLPCICCGKELFQSMEDEQKITLDSVSHQPFSGGMAAPIDAGYGSIFDTNVYIVAICDVCIEQKCRENKLTFIYSYMP